MPNSQLTQTDLINWLERLFGQAIDIVQAHPVHRTILLVDDIQRKILTWRPIPLRQIA